MCPIAVSYSEFDVDFFINRETIEFYEFHEGDIESDFIHKNEDIGVYFGFDTGCTSCIDHNWEELQAFKDEDGDIDWEVAWEDKDLQDANNTEQFFSRDNYQCANCNHSLLGTGWLTHVHDFTGKHHGDTLHHYVCDLCHDQLISMGVK